MSSTPASLDAQANERKARLAKLRSLKRKHSPGAGDNNHPPGQQEEAEGGPNEDTSNATAKYLSGRNYDITTRGPKLGFENAPTEGQETLEQQAAIIAAETAKRQAEEEKADKPVDLFTLQPKKPNWDLKRDLDRKLEVLNVRTDNAIARLVRQRIQQQQQESAKKIEEEGNDHGDTVMSEGEQLGMDGNTLLEGVHMREREEQEDERRAVENEDEGMS